MRYAAARQVAPKLATARAAVLMAVKLARLGRATEATRGRPGLRRDIWRATGCADGKVKLNVITPDSPKSQLRGLPLV